MDADRIETMLDRLQTIVDEAFGPFVLMSTDELLKQLETSINAQRLQLLEMRARAEAAEENLRTTSERNRLAVEVADSVVRDMHRSPVMVQPGTREKAVAYRDHCAKTEGE